MKRTTQILATALGIGLLAAAPQVHAQARPFLGLNLGVSQPTNDNYNAHARTGGSANPYAGYMFNDNLGIQGEVHAVFQMPDDDNKGISYDDQTSTQVGFTAGPRLSIPITHEVEIYATGQGGYFAGTGGVLTQSGPGFSVGGGLDYYLTEQFAISAFGRWNRAYYSPRPTFLPNQVAEDQGPSDIRWAVGGIGFKYDFREVPPPPPPPAKVAQAPAPPPPMKKKIVLRNVNFDFDKSNIRKDAVPVLNEAVATLKEEGTVAVIVEGHTDSKGSDAYNMKLSQRRAESVRKYLVDHGIAPSRLKTEGFGESKPVASNDTEEGRAQNRRVELHVE